jgi:soluble lytic murein transglycosylase-like protein
MSSVERVIFPGLIAGCVFLVFFTNLIANPHAALAAAEVSPQAPVATPIAGQEQLQAGELPAPAELLAGTFAAPVLSQSAGCTLSPNYPEGVRQWCGMIETYAARHGLEANLVAAVMLQESAGNPQAYSKSGAVGLMQVMPRDGLAKSFMCVNGPCFADRPSSSELFDPEFNISYGTGMLADLIQRRGSVRDALRAYGPMDMGYRYADLVLSIAARHRGEG